MASVFGSPSLVASAMLPPIQTPPPPKSAAASASANSGMSALIAGVMPVKNSVDQITQACRTIITSGAVPGSEQICAQILALAQGLLPMAMQNMFQSAGGPAGQSGSGIGNTSGPVPPPSGSTPPPPMQPPQQ